MLIKFPTKQNTLSYCLKGLNVSWNKLACLLTVEGSLVSTWIYTVWQLADIWRICLIGGPVETHFWNESEILHGSFLFEYQFSSLLSQKNCLESEKRVNCFIWAFCKTYWGMKRGERHSFCEAPLTPGPAELRASPITEVRERVSCVY